VEEDSKEESSNAEEATPVDRDARTKKHRRPKADEADAASVPESTWGYPSFAKDFPEHDELARLVEAFAHGNYAAVREGAPKLAASTDDAAVKKAAELLRERIEPDPTSRLLFLFAAILLAFLSFWWVTHDGPEGAAEPPLKPAPARKLEQ
jgi:hypothetical protein